MPKTLFKVDLNKPMEQQDVPGHNRWHPDIPAVVSVKPGDVFHIECKDWTDGQISNVEGRISGIVDVSNACCTLALTTAIFDKDIIPT